MANAPTEVKVEKVLSQPGAPWGGGNGKSKMRTYDEVLFDNEGQTRKAYVPEHLTLSDGETVRGWFNSEKGTWTIADPNPPQNAAGRGTSTSTGQTSIRDDATGQSIERQVAAKAAAEMAVAAGGDAPTLIANFEAYFDIVAAKIAGQPVVKADAA